MWLFSEVEVKTQKIKSFPYYSTAIKRGKQDSDLGMSDSRVCVLGWQNGSSDIWFINDLCNKNLKAFFCSSGKLSRYVLLFYLLRI